jgi:hypothetical protein
MPLAPDFGVPTDRLRRYRAAYERACGPAPRLQLSYANGWYLVGQARYRAIEIERMITELLERPEWVVPDPAPVEGATMSRYAPGNIW